MPPRASIFVDTSGWAEPLMGNSLDHVTMQTYYKQLIASKRSLVTTNYVIAELVALLTTRARFTRLQLLAIVNRIKQIPQLRMFHVDLATNAAAWAMLEQYTDKEWSLVDAARFVVMRQLGISEAFTTDAHFVQAGFIRMPAQ